jgi:hypothetical protein
LVTWNELIDFNIRGPSNHEDIPDIFVYLIGSNNDVPNEKHRICFARFKAKALLDKEDFTIEKYFFQEDKALDKLDDEQFPGMFFARAKIYDRNTNVKLRAD